MIGKKINQLATELAPLPTDLTIIGDPTTGVSKKITLEQISSLFGGSVSFYTNLASFPAVGNIDIIYCAKDTNKLYLWGGSSYVEVFPSQSLLNTYQLRSEKGNANGYASLDSLGKVPISQLPSSLMEYKGTWNAATNTPTLANGTGDTGDVYICNVAGTVNFGAGPLTFAVGDYVIYSGSIWQRSSGAVGTVTSVSVSRSGDALAITGSPITTSGTINLGFAGNSTQYINGAGNLVTFPGVINEAQNLITEVYNKTGATLTKGTVVYINGGQGNLPAVTKALATGDSTSAQTYGIVRNDITNNNNGYVVVAGRISDLDTQAYTEGTQLYLSPTTAGTYTSTKPYAPQHLVYVGIVVRAHPTQGVVEVKIMNGFEIDELHNVAAQTPTNNDGLFWESATSLWKNKSIATVLGYTPQPQLNGTGFVKASGTTISYDNSTYVTTDTFQTISASKTFSVGLSLASAGGTNQLTSFVNTSSLFSGSAGSNVLGFNSANNIYFGKGSNNGGVLQWTNSTVRYYTLPDATGTIALTSDIPSLTGYVPYTGATANVNLGTNDLLSRSVYIEGTASYQAGLLMRQISGFNFVTGAYTQVVPSGIYDLYVVHNQTNGTRRRYAISVAALQDNDSFQYLVPRKDGTFAMTSDIPSLTGYVQGTGTTNYLPKFTGTSTIGNSLVYDNGSGIGIGTATPSGFTRTLKINAASGTIGLLLADADTDRAGFYIDAGTTAPAYIFTNNSKPLVFSVAGAERMRLDASGNLGLGVTPSAWSSPFIAFQLGTFNQYIAGQTNAADMKLGTNHYYGSGDYRYGNSTDRAARYDIGKDGFFWQIAPSGTAGNAISFTQAMTLNASGNLLLGTTTDPGYGRTTASIYNSSGGILQVAGSSTTALFYVYQPDNIAVIGTTTNHNFAIHTNGTQKLLIASTGAATFSSSVDAYTSIKVTDGQYYIYDTRSNSSNRNWALVSNTYTYGDFGIKQSNAQNGNPLTAGTDRLYINPSGNVGIGTTSPSQKLEVNGAIKTGNPGLGSAGAIKLGQRFTGTAFGVGGYIPIDIDGTTYYINLATTTP